MELRPQPQVADASESSGVSRRFFARSAPAHLDGAAAACGADEFSDAPTGLVFDPVADGQGGEHDRQVSLDGFAFVVVDRSGLQVVFGHAEALLDAPQLVVGVDDELRGLTGEVGGVALLIPTSE